MFHKMLYVLEKIIFIPRCGASYYQFPCDVYRLIMTSITADVMFHFSLLTTHIRTHPYFSGRRQIYSRKNSMDSFRRR